MIVTTIQFTDIKRDGAWLSPPCTDGHSSPLCLIFNFLLSSLLFFNFLQVRASSQSSVCASVMILCIQNLGCKQFSSLHWPQLNNLRERGMILARDVSLGDQTILGCEICSYTKSLHILLVIHRLGPNKLLKTGKPIQKAFLERKQIQLVDWLVSPLILAQQSIITQLCLVGKEPKTTRHTAEFHLFDLGSQLFISLLGLLSPNCLELIL